MTILNTCAPGLLVVLMLLVSASAFAQSQPGHVYTLRHHKVHADKVAEYNAVYAEVVRPVLDRLKADGHIVSYLDLQQTMGTGETSHLLIIEFENYAAMDDANAKNNAASQAVLGRPYQEALGDLSKLREWTHTEVYVSTQN